MTIAYDNSSSIGETTGDGSWSHGGASSNVKGVLVYVIVQGENVDPLGVTYGTGGAAVAMTKIAVANDTATEKGNTTAWFLGSSIPQGTQTVAVDVGTATDWNAVCITYTGAADTTYYYGTLQENATLSNATEGTTYPTINQPSTVQSDWVNVPSAAVFSGQSALASVSAGTGFTAFGGVDHGQMVAQYQRYTTGTATGKPTVYFTADSDDVAMISVLVGEKRTASITTTTVAATTTIPTPTVTVFVNASVTTTTVAATTTIPTPTVVANAATTPTTVQAATSIDQPTKAASAAVTTTTVAASVQPFPATTTSASAAVTAGNVGAQVFIDTPVVAAEENASVVAGDVQSLAHLDPPTVTAEARAPPDAVAAQAALDTPTVAASSAATPVAVGAAVAVPTPTVETPGAGVSAFVTFLDPPTGLALTVVSGSQIDLDWDALVGADHYLIERDGVVVDTSGTNSYSDTGLDPNTQYRYRVKGVA